MSGLKKYRENAAELVSKMTLSEKAELVSGFSMWETRAAERLCVKKADMADGPHGIRKQLDYYDIAVDESVQTVGFPAGCCSVQLGHRRAVHAGEDPWQNRKAAQYFPAFGAGCKHQAQPSVRAEF